MEKRPPLLTIICILGYTWIVFSFPSVFSPIIKKLGIWYPGLFGLMVAANFISFVGVWHMKKWGVQLFIFTFFIKQIVLVLTEDISYSGLAFSILFIAGFLFYYKRMDVNL